GGKVKPNEPGHIASDTGALVVYEGARGYGQIVARNATELAIARAKTNGVAVVALKNAHHIGRVGTYGELCAAAGLVSLHFVNITDQRPAVAPWRGSDGRFGTNPLCIALPGPAPDRPIIADMATSRIAMGKVRVARNKGEEVAPGTLLDSDGKPTTDPHVMYSAPARRLDDLRRAQGVRARLYLRDAGGRSNRQRHDAPRAAGRRERHERHADDRDRSEPPCRPNLDARRDRRDDRLHYRLATGPDGRAGVDPRRPGARQPRPAPQ